MNFILFLVVVFFSFVIGTLGFAQIIGSLQNIKLRGIGMTLFTIILWGIILVGEWMLLMNFLPDYRIPYYVTTVISLLLVLGSGKIK